MLGEKLIIRKDHKVVAERLAKILIPEIRAAGKKYIVSIAGETGSGKSGIAQVLAGIMARKGIKSILIQQDDYFINPPRTNFMLRRDNMISAGISEVNMPLLQKHIKKFRDIRSETITKPLVVFDEDIIRKETIVCKNINLMIVEGTYVSLLEGIDKKIVLSRTYKDTYKERLKRKRDIVDKCGEKILAIEHGIVKGHKKHADIIVEKDYSVKKR